MNLGSKSDLAGEQTGEKSRTQNPWLNRQSQAQLDTIINSPTQKRTNQAFKRMSIHKISDDTIENIIPLPTNLINHESMEIIHLNVKKEMQNIEDDKNQLPMNIQKDFKKPIGLVEEDPPQPPLDLTITASDMFWYFIEFFMDCFPLIINRLVPFYKNVLMLVFYHIYSDNKNSIYAYSMALSLYMALFARPTQINTETQGIWCSMYFGQENYKKLRITFYQSVVFNFFITQISLLLFLSSREILVSIIGVDEEIANAAHSVVMPLVPSLFIQSIATSCKTYLICQKRFTIFVFQTQFSFFIYPIGCYITIVVFELGPTAFGMLSLFIEIVIIIMLIGIMRNLLDKKSLEFDTWEEIFDKSFLRYIKEFGMIFFGWYSVYLGIAFNSYLVSQLHDATNFYSVWLCQYNFHIIITNIFNGMANVTRTMVSFQLGQKNIVLARKYATMCLILTCAFSFITMVFVLNIKNRL